MHPRDVASAGRGVEQLSPAVRTLLGAADEVIAMAKGLQAARRDGDALACAAFAAEYIRAAKSMQAMDDASAALDAALSARAATKETTDNA